MPVSFSEPADLVVDFNVDGTQNKKSLRRYENFFAALLGRFLNS